MSAACSPPKPEPTPFATRNPARGVWETYPINPACGHWACYSRTWPTLGYDASWTCVRPCHVGAPHHRERVFVACPTQPGTRRVSAEFVEWMMGLIGHVTGTPELSRAAQLRLLGNSVVPQQADHALNTLLARAGDYAPGYQEIAWDRLPKGQPMSPRHRCEEAAAGFQVVLPVQGPALTPSAAAVLLRKVRRHLARTGSIPRAELSPDDHIGYQQEEHHGDAPRWPPLLAACLEPYPARSTCSRGPRPEIRLLRTGVHRRPAGLRGVASVAAWPGPNADRARRGCHRRRTLRHRRDPRPALETAPGLSPPGRAGRPAARLRRRRDR